MKIEDGKSVRESWGFYPIDGNPIKPLVGMIYWLGWGDDEDFDVRVVRRILGLPAENPKLDSWFMAKKPNPCKAYIGKCSEIRAALDASGRSFSDVMVEHDRLCHEESERFNIAANLSDVTAADFPF